VDSEQKILQERLRGAVSSTIRDAVSNGKGTALPTYRYRVSWFEANTDKSGSIGKDEIKTVETYNPYDAVHLGTDPNEDVEAFNASVREIAERYSEINPHPQGHFVLTRYFDRVGQLKLDEETLVLVISEYLSYLRRKTRTIYTLFLLRDFLATDSFELPGGPSFRKATIEDANLLGRFFPRGQNPWFEHPQRVPTLGNDWVCEFRREGPKTWEELSRVSDLADEIAGALGLASAGRASLLMVFNNLDSPFQSKASSHSLSAIHTGIDGGKVELDREGIEVFRACYAAIQESKTRKHLRSLWLALRRFRLATTRANKEDQLVDFVVGLEALLTRESDPPSEVSLRFRLRGASLLSEDSGSAAERIDLMKSLYGFRSSVLHGKHAGNELEQRLVEAARALKTVLTWYLHRLRSPEEVISELDVAFVEGGDRWVSTQA